jgi:hypothetical protein
VDRVGGGNAAVGEPIAEDLEEIGVRLGAALEVGEAAEVGSDPEFC